jgi:HSP20 family protein
MTEPFDELEQMGERFRRMFDQAFGGYEPDSRSSRGWRPIVDLEETDDGYVVEAEVPGVKREDLQVELIGNELAITGESKKRERKGTPRKQMRRTGRFECRVTLSDHVENDKVEAKLDDGLLTVRIPKSERAERRKIEVTS